VSSFHLKKFILEFLDRKNISEKHRRDTINRLNNHVFKHIGDMNIREVKKLDIVNVFRNLIYIPETARRLFNILEKTFKYASTLEIIERNIMVDMDINILIPQKETKNYPHIIDTDRMRKFLLDIENCNWRPYIIPCQLRELCTVLIFMQVQYILLQILFFQL